MPMSGKVFALLALLSTDGEQPKWQAYGPFTLSQCIEARAVLNSDGFVEPPMVLHVSYCEQFEKVLPIPAQ